MKRVLIFIGLKGQEFWAWWWQSVKDDGVVVLPMGIGGGIVGFFFPWVLLPSIVLLLALTWEDLKEIIPANWEKAGRLADKDGSHI